MKSKMPEISRNLNRRENTRYAVEKHCKVGLECIRKTRCVMVLLFLSLACATNDLCAFKNMLNRKELEINPHGPLSKERGILHQECNHIELKQQLDPNSNWHYKLEIKKLEKPTSSSNYTIGRKISQKKYTISQAINSKLLSDSDYKKEYHAVLQHLFSDNRCIGILNTNVHHFYSILSKEETSNNPKSYMLLASLFLLSEGLKLPLSINVKGKTNTVAVLEPMNGLNNSAMFCIDLFLPSNGEEKKPADDKKKKTQDDDKKKKKPANDKGQNSAGDEKKASLEMTKKSVHNIKACAEEGLIEGCAECIITFFIKYCEKCNSEREGFAEPNTYQDYMTGKFMNAPGFLIQNFVHQYIKDDTDKRMLFASSVYTLIQDCLPLEECQDPKLAKLGEQAKNILNRCFIEKSILNSELLKAKERITIDNIANVISAVGVLSDSTKKKIPDKMEAKQQIERIIEKTPGKIFIDFLLIDYAAQGLESYKRADSKDNISFIKSGFEIANESSPDSGGNLKGLVYIGHLLKRHGYIEVVCALLVRAACMDLDGKRSVAAIIRNLLWYRSFNIDETQDFSRHLIVLIDLLGESKKYFYYDKLPSDFAIRFNDIDKEKIAQSTASMCSYLLKKKSMNLLNSFIKAYLQNWARFGLPIISEVFLKMPGLLDKKDLLFLLTEKGMNINFITKIAEDIETEHGKQDIEKEFIRLRIKRDSTRQNTNNRRHSLFDIPKTAIDMVRRASGYGSDLISQKNTIANMPIRKNDYQLVVKKLHLVVLKIVMQCKFHFNEIKDEMVGLVSSYSVFKENDIETIKCNRNNILLLNEIILLINDVKQSFGKLDDYEIYQKLTKLDKNYTDTLRAIQVTIFKPKISKIVGMCVRLIDDINTRKRSEEATKEKESINTENIQEIINKEDTNEGADNKANGKSAHIQKVSDIVDDIIKGEENLVEPLEALEIIYKEIRDTNDIQKAKDALTGNNNNMDIFACICKHMYNNTEEINDVVEKDQQPSQSLDMA
ncbi:hypothetical protein NEPAR05_1143 [Nematocida parisii]|nr:hypothetical protein NEPAR05_1143 [Nematocida parisii]